MSEDEIWTKGKPSPTMPIAPFITIALFFGMLVGSNFWVDPPRFVMLAIPCMAAVSGVLLLCYQSCCLRCEKTFNSIISIGLMMSAFFFNSMWVTAVLPAVLMLLCIIVA